MEALEQRLAMAGDVPPLMAGSPYLLPDAGEWRSTTFNGSPIFSDLDGDGKDELIVTVSGGRMMSFKSGGNGSMVPFKTYDSGGPANFKSTPVVVTKRDGTKLVVGALGRDELAPANPPQEDGRVFAFNALTGAVAWIGDTGKSIPNAALGGQGAAGVGAPLATGDLDHDGEPEVVVAAISDYVTAFRLDGSVMWRFDTDDSAQSGPVIADIDRDGWAEVVFGSDASPNPYYHAGGFVNILNHNGSAKFRFATAETIWSSPSLVDFNNDGKLEIVVGTGYNYVLSTPSDAQRAQSNRVYAFDQEGRVLPGWPYVTGASSLNRAVFSSPAVGDLNGDGVPEVVLVDFVGQLHVIQWNGRALPGFEGGKSLYQNGVNNIGSWPSAIIADVNGDGRPDIVSGTGPFLTAYDAKGNQLFSDVTATPRNPGAADQNFATPAVGQFDGQGGLELAVMLARADTRNQPEFVKMFQLPKSTLTPPWPMQRKDAGAHALMYTDAFLRNYISATMVSLVDRPASGSDLAFFSTWIQDQRFTLRSFAESVARTPESTSVVVKRLYSRYLDRPPTEGELSAGTALLLKAPARDLIKNLMLSDEFKRLAGGTNRGVAMRMFSIILGRDPDGYEQANVIEPAAAGTLSAPSLADQLLAREEFLLRDIIAPFLIAYRAYFPSSLGGIVDPASIGAVLLDNADGRREDDMRAGLIYTGENYAATSATGTWVQSLARDLEGRELTSSEVDTVLRRFAARQVDATRYVREVIASPQARAKYIRERVSALLGRAADDGLVNLLVAYPDRDFVTNFLLSSDEYFNRNGANNTSFVQALFRDLAGYDMSAAQVAPWVKRLTGYTTIVRRRKVTVKPEPRGNIVADLMKQDYSLRKRVTDLLFEFVPREDYGVLGTANNDPNVGPLVNPDPGLVNGLVGMRQSGVTEDEMLARVLETGMYRDKVAWDRGYFVKRMVRY